MGAAFWWFALSSAVAQKPWLVAVCSVNIWKQLLGVGLWDRRGLRMCHGAEDRGLVERRSNEGCCRSWHEVRRWLRRLKMRARIKTRSWAGLIKQGNWRQVRVVLGRARTPLNPPQCEQWPSPLLVNGTLSQRQQCGLNLVYIDFKMITELGKLKSSLGKRLFFCGHIGYPFPRYLPVMPFLSLSFPSLYFPTRKMAGCYKDIRIWS